VRQSAQPGLPVERSIARMGRSLYIESVEDAAAVVGGYEQLAAELGVSTDEVRNWCTGMTIPESMMFLRLIGLLFRPAALPKSDLSGPAG
jgi:hypothetical protein